MSAEKCVGDFVSLQRGNTYKSALLDQPGPYLLGLASIAREGGFRDDKLRTYGGPNADKLLLYPGDMYVSLKDVTQSGDLLGSVARVPDEIPVGRITQDTVKLVFKQKNAPKAYLYWVLRSPQYRAHCRARAMGTTNLSLSREDFLSYPVPELNATRQQLVAALEAIEAKITLNHQVNQTLEQMAQAIFKSWFVDFDPVKAKVAALEAGSSEEDALLAAMQAISGKSLKQLQRLKNDSPKQYAKLEATAELFPASMQDSELGEIPEGWGVGKLSDIATFPSNRISTEELSQETYVSTENMLENRRGVCSAFSLPSSATVPGFESKQILISNIRPYFKKIWFASHSGGRSPDVLCFESKCQGASEFLYNLLYQDRFFDYMMLTSKGAKMPRGDKKAIMQLMLAVPRVELMQCFSEHVEAFYKLVNSNSLETKLLASTRDTLLPKLLSGELRLPAAEEQVAEEADA
ncbi:restriction endonuclease subunit S [Halomonas daqingensis]|uniref:restriction endonuclease subunit S n=1 Tax=Billgrantia desiderata TaxID=52021 RepID=UPI001F1935D8|nr:restriction endonuclease subunit S [Halomonas desiderata]MCE8030032.1 restriction endonuclease subunit S [Halomonas desiderata]